MDTHDVSRMICRAKGKRSIRDLADDWHMDYSYLYRMMTGEREPNEQLLGILGLERVVSYRRQK